LLKVSKQQPP